MLPTFFVQLFFLRKFSMGKTHLLFCTVNQLGNTNTLKFQYLFMNPILNIFSFLMSYLICGVV